jgi:predicted oxidoreductase
MPDRKEVISREGEGAFDRGFDGHSRRQARLGLTLTPAERLRWLEETMDQLRPLVGRARQGRPVKQEAS